MTRSTVADVQANGTYENANGVDLGNGKKGYYSFIYTMETGETLKANHKMQQPFPVGALVDYEIRGSNDYGAWGSVKKPQDGPPPVTQEHGQQQSGPAPTPGARTGKKEDETTRDSIEAQVALKEAVQTYHTAGMGGLEATNQADPVQVIIDTADRYTEWLKSKRAN